MVEEAAPDGMIQLASGQGMLGTILPMAQPEEIEAWIPANEALERAAETLSSPSRAKAVLTAHLKAGRLQTIYKAVVIEPDFGPIATSFAAANRPLVLDRFIAPEGRWAVACAPWWKTDRPSIFDAEPWKWEISVFCRIEHSLPLIARLRKDKSCHMLALPRMIVFDVHMLVGEIDRAISINSTTTMDHRLPVTSERKVRRSRLLSPISWRMVLQPFQELAEMGSLALQFEDFSIWGSLAALERAIAERLETIYPSDDDTDRTSTIRRRAKGLIRLNEERAAAGH